MLTDPYEPITAKDQVDSELVEMVQMLLSSLHQIRRNWEQLPATELQFKSCNNEIEASTNTTDNITQSWILKDIDPKMFMD